MTIVVEKRIKPDARDAMGDGEAVRENEMHERSLEREMQLRREWSMI